MVATLFNSPYNPGDCATFVEHKTKKFPLANLSIAGTEQLLDMKMEIDSVLDDIKNQLDRSKANAKQGIMADPDWFARINGAKRILGRKSQRIQMELSKRKEQARHDRKTYEAAFINVAKRLLSVELYERIEIEAREDCIIEAVKIEEDKQWMIFKGILPVKEGIPQPLEEPVEVTP